MSKHLPKIRKGRFLNPHIEDIKRKPRDFFLWLLGFYRDTDHPKVPKDFKYPVPKKDVNEDEPWAMWMGHSSYLISTGSHHILTDPIWSKRASPVSGFGPKRREPAPIAIDKLPKIDYVLISHDHYDHLDKRTVLKLQDLFPDIVWIVPLGVKKWFIWQGISRVVELNWWQEVDIDSIFKITAVPSQHFSGRKAPDLNKTLWAGYVVEDLLKNKTFYFVGDTGYNPHDFKKIGEVFDDIDLSLIPIGTYSPRSFMSAVHIEPKDAVKVHLDVGSKLSLGMHYRTFKLSEEPMNQPPYDLYLSMKDQNLDPTNFLPIVPGHKINW